MLFRQVRKQANCPVRFFSEDSKSATIEMKSPHERIRAVISGSSDLTYDVLFCGEKIVSESHIGIIVKGVFLNFRHFARSVRSHAMQKKRHRDFFVEVRAARTVPFDLPQMVYVTM